MSKEVFSLKNTIYLKWLYVVIEYHWKFIMHYRKVMERMYDSGISLSDPKMLKANSRCSRHCLIVTKAEKEYEHIAYPLDEEQTSAVIDRFCHIVSAADRTVECHDRCHRTVNFLR